MKKQIFTGKIENGKIKVGDKFYLLLGYLEGKKIYIEIGEEKDKRTGQQNNALHKLFALLAEEMVEKGIDFRMLLDEEIYYEPTPENIKVLWKKLQKALLDKESTTELNKVGDIERVYDNFNKIISERTGGEISLPPFPSLENYGSDN